MSKKILWLTTTSMNIEPVIGALRSIEEYDLDIWEYRFDSQPESSFFDESLVLKVSELAPDCVFYIGSLEGPYLARPHVYQAIKEICPIVNIVFDGGCPNGWPALKTFRENKCFSTIVNIDGNHDWPKGENDLTLLCPIDPRPYLNNLKKDIPFGFYGGSTSEDRSKLLEALKKEKLITTAERNEAMGSYQPYADFMLRCQVVLNMAKTGSGKTMHVKARVSEAGLARACLLEPKGSPTKNWFKPDFEYLEYSNVADLIDKVKLLNKETLFSHSLGEALHKKMIIEYAPYRFFDKIFDKIGLKIPLK